MNLRIFIADDEAPARDRLIRLLQEPGYECCGWAADGDAALRGIEQLRPDIALLDIRMPGQDGLEVATAAQRLPIPPAIVFVTAYDEFMLEAFRRNAQGYLLKPVRKAALLEALAGARRINQAQLQHIQASMPSEQGEALTLRDQHGEHRIPLNQILYLQADQKYVSILTLTGTRISDRSLKDYEQAHPALLRIHRNMLINRLLLRNLQRTEQGTWVVRLEGLPEPLLASRRAVGAIREALRAG